MLSPSFPLFLYTRKLRTRHTEIIVEPDLVLLYGVSAKGSSVLLVPQRKPLPSYRILEASLLNYKPTLMSVIMYF